MRVAGKVDPVFVDEIGDMAQTIVEQAQPGDVVISMGARSIGAVPAQVVELLGGVRLKQGIAVAGSHGKTTTTSLIATVLDAGGLDPDLGDRRQDKRAGRTRGSVKGEYLVAEADESDGSFMRPVADSGGGGDQHRPRAPRPLRAPLGR